MFQPDQVNPSEFCFWIRSANFDSNISLNVVKCVLGHSRNTLNSPVARKMARGRGKRVSITTPRPWAFICNEHHKAIFFGNMAPFKSVLKKIHNLGK